MKFQVGGGAKRDWHIEVQLYVEIWMRMVS